MNDVKLKQCPFCGGAALDTKSPSHTGKEFNIVYCVKCCASTAKYSDREMAVNAWNRRHSDEAIHD